ncbi:MAG: bifunctional phosphoglucose/phosphomannose isomerase [Firmicutes bacterium]|nr:bifunctional phosphoglucose/phosphomannose isomerase [Bacillota bacterium]
MKSILENKEAYSKLDSENVLDLTVNYHQQFATGLRLAEEQFKPNELEKDIDKIVVFGTGGGSAASGYLLKSFLFDKCKLPVLVYQGYDVPEFIDEKTLIFVTSYSGNTEETLSAYQKALAKSPYCVIISTGGKISETARQNQHPVIEIPTGIAPRAALGYIVIPMLVVLEKLRLIPSVRNQIKETISLLKELSTQYAPDVPLEGNLAKQTAQKLHGKIPLVYGTLELMEAVAWRWKRQLGENSKALAFFNTIPMLHHDEIVGWDDSNPLTEHFAVIFVSDTADDEKIKKRTQITTEILADRAGEVINVSSRGESELARMFSLVYLGDFVSIYLPMLKNVDPSPVDFIVLFKQKMGQKV